MLARCARLASCRASAAARAASSITHVDGKLVVPDEPIIPFIEGDGTGPDIWRATRHVLDSAVAKAYGGRRKLAFTEVLAGEKAFNQVGEWLPAATLDAFRKHLVGIKGPLTTPVGGGIRSLNVALRQELDLFVCLRPVRWFTGVPSPVKRPELVDMVIFRENCEDIYAGIEFSAGSPEAAKFASFLKAEFPGRFAKVRFPGSSAYGIKPVSREGSERLVAAALDHALAAGRKSVTLVHKGNIMKATEGGFRDWGYAVARSPRFRRRVVTEREAWVLDNEAKSPGLALDKHAASIEPGYPLMTASQRAALRAEVEGVLGALLRDPDLAPTHGGGRHRALLLVRDAIADITLQQVLTRPEDFSVIATLNLNGDYLSDALAAQVGGIGIAPGGNINYDSGHAIFEATHGTAPKYAGQDKVNPGSMVLSGELMLRHLGWPEAADLVIKGLTAAIAQRTVTYDFARQMEQAGDRATLLKCSEFGAAIVRNF